MTSVRIDGGVAKQSQGENLLHKDYIHWPKALPVGIPLSHISNLLT